MARMSQTLPIPLGGVSQKPDTEMGAAEVKRMENCLLSRTDGIRLRPGTRHVGVINSDISLVPSNPFIHTVKRSSTDIYSIVVFDGELFVHNALTGSEKQVLTPSGTDYLLTATGLRATTIGDVTVILNKDTEVKKVDRRSEPMVYEALVYVKNAQYSNIYKLDFGGGNTVSYGTAALNDENANKTLATEDVAIGIFGVLSSNPFFKLYFDVVFYGASVLVRRKDGQDFSLQVTDSLAGQGLVLIKNTVQKFEDLPPRARAGMVVKVSGDPLTAKDDYWVKYEEVDKLNQDVGGVWREVPAPGSSEGLDPSTMPWALTRYGSPIGRRTVLKDPLAPIITDYPHLAVPRGFNPAGIEHGVQMLEDSQGTETITLTAADVAATYDGMAVVYVDVDNYHNPYSETVAVTLYGRESSGDAWAIQDLVEFWGGLRKSNVMLRSELKLAGWPVGSQFYVKVTMATGAPYKPRVFVHAGTHPTHPGFTMVSKPRTKVTYPVDSVYPPGHVERLRVAVYSPSGEQAGYFLVATAQVPPDEFWSAEQMAMNMTAAVFDEATSVFAWLEAEAVDGESNALSITLSHEPSRSPWFGGHPYGSDNLIGNWVYVNREFEGAYATCFLDSEEGWAENSLVGMSIKNITDGSVGVIFFNRDNIIQVAELDGGVNNVFAPGDQVEIIGTDGEYFLFDRINWTKRLSGSDESVPLPSFVGKNISEVFFYKNRLGFCSGESVITSASGDVFRFFRRTATDILDDDPIDVVSAHQNIAAFGAAVNWKEGLYLFSDSGHQFRFEGEPTLTPKTAAIRHIGSHPCTMRVRPMTVGDQLFFTRATVGYTRVLEMYMDSNGQAQTRDLTKDVPRYIEGSVVDMTGDGNVGSLFFLAQGDEAKNILYVWTFEKGADGSLVMGAWHKWTFDSFLGDTSEILPQILTLSMVDGQLYMMIVRTGHPTYGAEGVMLEKIDLTTPTETYQSHRDRSNVSNIVCRYNMLVELPTIYPRDDNGNAITDGLLKLTYVTVNYHKTGWLKFRGSTPSAPDFGVEAKHLVAPGMSGKLRLPVMSKNIGATLTIICDSTQGCGFTTLAWDGDYHKSRR